MVNTILLTCYYCIYLLSFLHLANCHCSLAGHYYSLWPIAIILPARRILCTYYLLFLLFEVFFASFLLYPSPYTMVRLQNARTLTDTDLFCPNNFYLLFGWKFWQHVVYLSDYIFLIEQCVRAY